MAKASDIYDDVHGMAGGDFNIIFGCLSMAMAVAQVDMVFHNPEITPEEVGSELSLRVQELVRILSADVMGRH